MDVVPGLLEAGLKVVDLSADFRLLDPEIYKEWYGKTPPIIKDAVYGLPELHRDAIKNARLVANPGCYPTGALLVLAPLVKLLDMEKPLVIDSKSGASGAGRSGGVETSFSEVNEGFKAYKVGCHRHTPEMVQELSILAGAAIPVTFTPHLLPVTRGILTTAYAWLGSPSSIDEVRALYVDFYSEEPFVRLMPDGAFPDISQVRGSNYCDIGLYYDAKDYKVIVVSAIDNLVKGASGQAVQNMNIMCGLEETSALTTPPVSI
jgi:N-acetyl-gamma-glutamyl-phosphate reductase